jgi:rhamnose transport system permease protein
LNRAASNDARGLATTKERSLSADADVAAAGWQARLGRLKRPAPSVRTLGPLIFLAALFVIFALTTSRFANGGNVRSILFTAAILVIATVAQSNVVITRNLDLSIGAVMAASAYLSLLLYIKHPGIGWLVAPVALAIGGLLGAVNGLVVSYIRIPSIIVTLGTMSVFRGVIYASANGRQLNTNQLPAWLLDFSARRFLSVPLIAFVALFIVVAVAVVLRRTGFGRTVYAVGSNAGAAEFYGLPGRRTVLYVYAASGVIAGLAGLLLAGQVGTVTVDIASGWELQTLAAAVIGGASLLGGSGSAAGAAIGALIIATIGNGLVQLGLSGYWQMFVQGCAIVAAVGFDVLLRRQSARRLGTGN